MRRIQRPDRLPLSYEQLWLWQREQVMPEGSGNYISGAWPLAEDMNLTAMEQGIGEVIRRHEALRTSIAEVAGEPVQVIAEPELLWLPVVDLSGLSAGEQQLETRWFARYSTRRPFDLTTAPMIRIALIHSGIRAQTVLFTMHHLIADGWSMNRLHQESETLTRHYANGLPSPLAEMLIQYADYVMSQRAYLSVEVLDDSFSYWRQRLTGAPRLFASRTDAPPPRSYRGAWQYLLISKSLSRELLALSLRENTTLYMTLLAIFKTLLSQYSGQTDICVGTPVTFRSWPGVEKLIGFFTNLLVLRTDLSGNPLFRSVLKRVRQVTLEAYSHHVTPIALLVENLYPSHRSDYSPPFQAYFNFLRGPQAATELSEFETGLLLMEEVENNTANYDLTLVVIDQGPGLAVCMEYKKALFDSATIKSMLSDFRALLERFVADPDKRIMDVSLPHDFEDEIHLLPLGRERAGATVD